MGPNKFYRYEAVQYASLGMDGDYQSPRIPNPKVVLRTYNLVRETPKGYWIGYGYPFGDYLMGKPIWVSKTARKRFAYPTKEEALNNFIKRNEKRIKIMEYQLFSCKLAIKEAKEIKID